MKQCVYFIMALVIILTCSGLGGQSVLLKELKPLMASPDDTLKVNKLIQESRFYNPGFTKLANELADSAMDIALRLNFQTGLIKAQRLKGQIATFDGEISTAIGWYEKALTNIGNNENLEREKISILLSRGLAYYLDGDLGKALEYYIEVEPLCLKPGYEDLLAKTYNNMGIAYRQLEKYEDAIRIYRKSLLLKEQDQDSLGMALTYNNIGIAYAFLNNHPESIQNLELAKRIYESLEDYNQANSVNLSLARSLYELDKKKEAKVLLLKAFELGDPRVPFFDLMQGKLLFSKICLEENEYAKANNYLQELYPRIETTPYAKSLQSYYILKASSLYGLDSLREAYLNMLNHKILTDTIVQTERLLFEQDMETKYLTKEKDDKIRIQELQIDRNKKERMLYIIALSALAIILALGFILYRQRQKANRVLNIKNAQIKKSLEEKEVLLKEIHHRVKNNLQIISSLLNLQSRQIKDPKALEAIKEGRNRVASMALIHKNLYQEDNLVGVDAAEYIDKLTDSLMSSYQINENQIHFQKDIDPVQLDVDVVIPLGLILNEVITNCLKYAFAEDEYGTIQMSLKQEEEGIRLLVADNGRGLPSDFNLEELSSLGFRLIKAFTQKLEAILNISSKKGTQIEVFIPN